jgi:hypothetical protein
MKAKSTHLRSIKMARRFHEKTKSQTSDRNNLSIGRPIHQASRFHILISVTSCLEEDYGLKTGNLKPFPAAQIFALDEIVAPQHV